MTTDHLQVGLVFWHNFVALSPAATAAVATLRVGTALTLLSGLAELRFKATVGKKEEGKVSQVVQRPRVVTRHAREKKKKWGRFAEKLSVRCCVGNCSAHARALDG